MEPRREACIVVSTGRRRIEVYCSRSRLRKERWHWRAVSMNKRELFRSSEGYSNMRHAVDMARTVQRDGDQLVILHPAKGGWSAGGVGADVSGERTPDHV